MRTTLANEGVVAHTVELGLVSEVIVILSPVQAHMSECILDSNR